MAKKQQIIGLSILGLVIVGAGVWFGLQSVKVPGQPLEISGIYLPEPKPLAEFELIHDSDQPFTRQDFKGQWSFLYFGYTFCPDACPLTLAQLNQLDKQLSAKNADQGTAYMLISVDPKRDTPQRLAEYTRYFNPKFSGATGQPQQLQSLTKPLGVYYSVPENPEDPENYLVDHSSTVILINPDAELQALFTPPHKPNQMAEEFIAIRQRFSAYQ